MYSGYVYLIGSSVFGWYKIGKSITPEIRIKDLGILLPFKIEVIGVWGAKDHHKMEKALHEMYKEQQINGEWFEFTKEKIQEVFSSIPPDTRIFPLENSELSFRKFSNVEEDTKKSRKVIGVRVQKLRGNFTAEEREARRIEAIKKQKEKKRLKNLEIAVS